MNERVGHLTQCFIHDTEPQAERFDPPKNTGQLVSKPEGGLWTSTLRADGTSGWLDWCQAENWGIGEESVLYALEPKADCSVLVIDSEDDLHTVLESYSRDETDFPSRIQMFAPLDFEALQERYDAIQLTENGQLETRFTTPGLYGWDSECSLWLRYEFDTVEEIGSVTEISTEGVDADG